MGRTRPYRVDGDGLPAQTFSQIVEAIKTASDRAWASRESATGWRASTLFVRRMTSGAGEVRVTLEGPTSCPHRIFRLSGSARDWAAPTSPWWETVFGQVPIE